MLSHGGRWRRLVATILALRFDGSLYFAYAGYFEPRGLTHIAAKPHLKFVILDAEGINQIDATGEEILHTLSRRRKSAGVQLVIARAKRQLIDIFHRTHFDEHLGKEHFFRTRTDAILYARAHLGDQEQAEPIPLLKSESAFV